IVTPDLLNKVGLIKYKDKLDKEIKILGNGELTKTLEIHAHKITKKALKKLEKTNSKFVKLPNLTNKFKKNKKSK
ncbi:MAG: uL15 family ribosomal protein, partial [bacterium]